jgi:hypothetical protein
MRTSEGTPVSRRRLRPAIAVLAALAVTSTAGLGASGAAARKLPASPFGGSARQDLVVPEKIAGTVTTTYSVHSGSTNKTETLKAEVTFTLALSTTGAYNYRGSGTLTWTLQEPDTDLCTLQGKETVPITNDSSLGITVTTLPWTKPKTLDYSLDAPVHLSATVTATSCPEGPPPPPAEYTDADMLQPYWFPPSLGTFKVDFGKPLAGSKKGSFGNGVDYETTWHLTGAPWRYTPPGKKPPALEPLAPLAPLVGKGGTITVPDDNVILAPLVAPMPEPADASGTARVNAAGGGTKKSAPGPLLGSARFHIAAGQRATTVKIALNATGRTLVRERGRVAAILSVVLDATAGRAAAATSTPVVLVG